jgi:hypothetical protein
VRLSGSTDKGSSLNTVIYGDCVEIMRQMQPGSSDFVITDPLYISRYARDDCGVANNNNLRWLEPAFAQNAPAIQIPRLTQSIDLDQGQQAILLDINEPHLKWKERDCSVGLFARRWLWRCVRSRPGRWSIVRQLAYQRGALRVRQPGSVRALGGWASLQASALARQA